MRLLLVPLACLAAALVGPGRGEPNGPSFPPDEAQAIDFARDVRPILAGTCFPCHGPKKERGGLRLDQRERALRGGDSGLPAIVPGDGAASELVRRITTDDELDAMPAMGKPLEPEQVELLVRWIDAGAPWTVEPDGPHWAWSAPDRPPLPDVEDERWVRNPIDRFVLARLEREGLAPSPEADRATLIRRVSFDLTGLPPTPDEVDAFLADERPDAYERLVERLLASPHYGERWARHWMDLARYADSNGLAFDSARSIWPWRDWVIDAFNRDLPFDRFTIEQLAGDLLPEAAREQLVATGFHRNTMVQEEGGADEEEFRVEAVKDRVETTATVWLGATLQCAQCHDHKYDPFSQRDYYALYAFFNQTHDRGRSTIPKLELPTPEEQETIRRIEAEVARLRASIDPADPSFREAQREWEAGFTVGDPGWTPLVPTSASSTGGVTLRIEEDGSVVASGPEVEPPVDKADYTVAAATELEGVTALKIELLPDESFPGGGPGRAFNGNFILTELVVRAIPLADVEGGPEPEPLAYARSSGSLDRPMFPVAAAVDGDKGSGWGVGKHTGRAHEAVFVFEEPVAFPGGTLFAIDLEQQWGFQATIGRFRLSVTDQASPPRARPHPAGAIAEILATAPEERSAQDANRVREFFIAVAPEFDSIRSEIMRLEESRPEPVTSLILREVAEPRSTHLMRRGDFLALGEEVEPAVPAILPQIEPEEDRPADEPLTRLDLARWLVDDANPLTARVVVNRWWQRFFGLGLVETSDDFGTRGAAPSHPELLDWLAVELRENGWSIKRMHALIVGSATYRQSSRPRPELARRDPKNRLLAHHVPRRLEAEIIRDAALTASGLLDRRIGGPPVHPPLPNFVRLSALPKPWPESEAPDRFRRTLYTWIWRTDPYPFLATFDLPEATRTCSRRRSANTPLQALTLANDPMIVELAEGLALRALSEVAPEAGDRERLARAFRWCLARPPEPNEIAILEDFLAEERASFAAEPEAARLAAPEVLPDGVDPVEAAAWTAVARVLFNLDEFVTRG